MSAALITILAALTSTASPDCSDQLFGNVPPAPVVDVASWKVRDLCFDGFRLEHSGLSRTPLWVAEHLTADRIEAARALPRKDQFHPEPSLPKDERAEMADYRGGGYDRGHMAPDGDMADPVSEHDSFSLANMIPQVPSVNRGGWAHLEAIVRKLAERDGEVYVVTGPIFAGDKLQTLNDRVLVPTGMFKAVFDPKGPWTAAYVMDNVEDATARVVSVEALKLLTRFDIFPAVPASIESEIGPLSLR